MKFWIAFSHILNVASVVFNAIASVANFGAGNLFLGIVNLIICSMSMGLAMWTASMLTEQTEEES